MTLTKKIKGEINNSKMKQKLLNEKRYIFF